jgi:hypothetical protein
MKIFLICSDLKRWKSFLISDFRVHMLEKCLTWLFRVALFQSIFFDTQKSFFLHNFTIENLFSLQLVQLNQHHYFPLHKTFFLFIFILSFSSCYCYPEVSSLLSLKIHWTVKALKGEKKEILWWKRNKKNLTQIQINNVEDEDSRSHSHPTEIFQSS